MKKKVFEKERRKHKKHRQTSAQPRQEQLSEQPLLEQNDPPVQADLPDLASELIIRDGLEDADPSQKETVPAAESSESEEEPSDTLPDADSEARRRLQTPVAADLGQSVRMSDLVAAKGELPQSPEAQTASDNDDPADGIEGVKPDDGQEQQLSEDSEANDLSPAARPKAAPGRPNKTAREKNASGKKAAKAAPDRKVKTASPSAESADSAGSAQNSGSPFVRFLKKTVRVVLTWEFLCIVIVLFFAFRLLSSIYSIGLLKVSLGGWIFGIVLAGLFIAGFWFFQTRSRLWKIPAVLLCAALVCAIFGGESYVDSIANGLAALTNHAQEYTVQTGVYVPSDIPLASVQALESQTVGYIPGRNAKFYKSVLDELSRQGVRVRTQSFPTLQQLYKAVRGQSIRAALLTPADLRIISEFSDSKQPSAGLSSAFSVNLGSGLISESASIDVTKDPFTVLVSGSRSPLSQEAYSSTLNLLLTVNPSSGEMLVTVIPRALAVAAFCSENFGCREDELQIDRIGLMSFRSQEALRQTVENQFGLPVNFMVRVDLNSISQMYAEVDGLYKSGTHTYHNAAELTRQEEKAISGPKILQLVGTPGSYSGSDFDQELNQLVMLEEIMSAISKITPMNITKICDILDDSVTTTFDYAQLCALIREYVILPEPLIISYNTIEGVWEPRSSEMLTESTYMLNPSVESMEAARNNVRLVLDGQPPQTDGTLSGTNQSPSATDDLADNPPENAESQAASLQQPAQ